MIAQLSINRAPFLIGDVLLSSETIRGVKVNLPLVGDINQILADRGFAFEVGLAQKINIINKRVVVGWSGQAVQAEKALRVLTAISDRPMLDADRVIDELKAISHEIDQLQLVGLVLGERQGSIVNYSCFAIGVPAKHAPNFGSVRVAGSGCDAFLSLLQKAAWTSDKSAGEFQVAHGLLAALTNEEFRTGSTIANRWGGGFEALVYSPQAERFEKVGDVLHTFWRTSEKPGGSLDMFPYFYKTTYWNDALILRTATLDFERARLVSNDTTLVPPLLKRVEDYDLTQLSVVDFGYRAVCCHVLIEKQHNRDVLYLVDQHAAEQAVWLEVIGVGASLRISDYLPNIIREQLS
ncbi:hypothetical protein [Bradyrhizobium sp.]|uniref:hypothetical protein n=1 Tax=Bradyrhizobium sp. TaxID=376 RepID=UPI0026036D6D|nr:hypothetical protein [Bradyrhizobium sp.]